MCLGGIDLETHEWVRPIGKCEEGIREFRCFLNGRFLKVGDILELDLLPVVKPTEFQRENWLIANWNWHATRRVSARNACQVHRARDAGALFGG